MLGTLRSGRGHPTPEQAFAALAQTRCLYSPISSCSGPVQSVGLRDDDDVSAVLVCRAHYGRLRRLDEQAAEAYRRHLERAFAATRPAQDEPEPQEPETVSWPQVMTKRRR